MKKAIAIVVLLALAGGGYWWYKHHKPQAGPQTYYRTAQISRLTITQEVSATGIIQPMQEVEVGTQVTGKIISLKADYNSRVKAGEVVAEIDPATYEASYASAKASLASAQASLEKTRASLALAEKELKRLEQLLKSAMISESEYDTQLASRDQLRAEEKSNLASIAKAEAEVKQAKTNLDYCTIVSPVTGVVLSRDVDEGQTVVSNMSASSLFKIANDLSRVKVEASIPEADVGQLKVGQDVRFHVDAYEQDFQGKVTQIRLAATTESNVVTYPVIVEAENPDGKLFPGMTATIAVIIAKEENCLSVPAAALRFQPEGFEAPPEGEVIWLARSKFEIEPVPVQLGITDSINQAILCDMPLEGREVATGILTAEEIKKSASGTNNPFQMRPPGPPPRGGGGPGGGPGGPPPGGHP